MKCYYIFLVFIQLTILCSVNAQIFDDFSDGNFSENPTWQGDSVNFIVNQNDQLQLNAPPLAGKSFLSTPNEIINNAEWNFYVNLDFNPSSSNYTDIYLISDVENLAGLVNGYFVRIGNTQDEVSLYRQVGDKASSMKIIDGMDDRVAFNQVELNVKVTKSSGNNWELLVDTDLTQNFISEGSVVDGTNYFSRYFGIFCEYTSTRSNKFFFDNLSIEGDAYLDSIAPKLDSIIVLSDSSLMIYYNEFLHTSNATNIDNYFVNNGIGNPNNIELQHDTIAILYFEERFNDAIENQISIHGIEDLFGNSLDNFVISFTYLAPYIIAFGDIIITEIMADPTPGVDLPEYEYIEIHNPHNEIFALSNTKFIVGNDTANVPDLIIEPKEFIILSQHAAVEQFEHFGRTIKIANWPTLNNRGETITMINQKDELIYSVEYDDSWYNSIDKDDGGYSLEMIDTNFPCKGRENWIASINPSGGTPGNENSVKTELTDLSAPEIENVIAVSDLLVKVYLSENIGPNEVQIENISILPYLEIESAKLESIGFKELYILLNTTLEPKTNYQLTIKNLTDCSGNIQKATTLSFVLPEIADSLDLLINEILFNPWPDGVDFVELYNQSEKYINLKSIRIGNDELNPITEEHIIIEPKQHMAITSSPNVLNNHYPSVNPNNILKSITIPAFNDTEGNVIIADDNGNQLDFFHYEKSFHSSFLNDTEGVSLERISYENQTNNPNNWQSAASTSGFATPGEVNSQLLLSNIDNEEVTVEPKVFDPGNNGFHDFTNIKCRFSSSGNIANIRILDATGRIIKTIISHQSIGAEEDFKWEGLDDNGQEVRMGPYIVFLEIYNSSGMKKLYRKKVVVGHPF